MEPEQSTQKTGQGSRLGRAWPPVVFMFQPTHYEVVPDDRLAQWEEDVHQNVRLGSERSSHIQMRMRPVRGGTGTWCGCPTFDDCDEI